MTEESREVAEAREAVWVLMGCDYDAGCHPREGCDCPETLDALVEAVRKDERERAREVLQAADRALNENIVTWIALSRDLETPYTDAPHLSPWSRFGKRAADTAVIAQEAVRAYLAAPAEGGTEG